MEIPYGKQWIDEDDIEAVVNALRSDYLTTGPRVQEFEEKLADFAGADYGVAAANGTAALHIACMAIGLQKGDEVITTPITFAASANCILYCGAVPVFADIDPVTYNISPDSIRKCITKRTKAVIAVHYCGQPCDMDAISQIAREYNLIVIEDAAHALGADYKGRKIGSLSDMTCFSFHPVKHITTGEGGMVTTNNRELYEKLALLRTHGITRDEKSFLIKGEGPWYYEQSVLGYNYRISDIQCALGLSQLKKLNFFLEKRYEIVRFYQEALKEEKDLILPAEAEGCHSSWHLYVIQVRAEKRRTIFEQLRADGIGVNVHYIPVYKHPYYQKHGYSRVYCKEAEQLYSRMITLPVYPALTQSQQEYVIEKVKAANGKGAIHLAADLLPGNEE